MMTYLICLDEVGSILLLHVDFHLRLKNFVSHFSFPRVCFPFKSLVTPKASGIKFTIVATYST